MHPFGWFKLCDLVHGKDNKRGRAASSEAAEVRMKIFTPEQCLEYLERAERQKREWLKPPYGKPHPRPEHEIQRQREDLEILQYMISRYHERQETSQ
jgi:hypothetical protein